MKIIKAESAGFCFGVKRAVDTVYKCTETGTDEKFIPTDRSSTMKK